MVSMTTVSVHHRTDPFHFKFSGRVRCLRRKRGREAAFVLVLFEADFIKQIESFLWGGTDRPEGKEYSSLLLQLANSD